MANRVAGVFHEARERPDKLSETIGWTAAWILEKAEEVKEDASRGFFPLDYIEDHYHLDVPSFSVDDQKKIEHLHEFTDRINGLIERMKLLVGGLEKTPSEDGPMFNIPIEMIPEFITIFENLRAACIEVSDIFFGEGAGKKFFQMEKEVVKP